MEFANLMIQNLTVILLTAQELSGLRQRLVVLDQRENSDFFVALYKSWCHNAVSTLALCLLVQQYEHASDLVQSFGSLVASVNLLIQLDKLVQLLESPVFTCKWM